MKKRIEHKFLMFLFLFSLQFTIAQTSVSGVVSDTSGNPLPGVVVQAEGKEGGVQTDFYGAYTIDVEAEGVLVFNFLGMQTQQVSVNSQTSIDIVMQEDASELDQVVVTGYTAQAKKSITGAVSVVNVAELENLPDQSALGAIQGRTTGVQISKSGGPGGSNLVRIRGFSNTTTSNPLYIIDGVQTQNGDVFNLINPADIESIQILKDASSAAIYGARANNGVIIVTTKKGATKEVKLNVSMSTAIQTPRTEAYPTFLTPQQYADYIWNTQKAQGSVPTSTQYGSGDNPVLPNYLTPAGASTADISTYSLEAGADNNPIKKADKEGTDWLGEILAPGILNNINVSASKGGDNSSFFISGSYSSNEGVLRHTSFDRYSLRANTDVTVKDFLTLGEDITVAYSERKGSTVNQTEGGPIMQAHRIMPIIPVYDEKGNFAGTAGGGLGNGSNPLAALSRDKDDVARTIRTLASVYAKVKILENIEYKSSVGVDYSSTSSSDFKSQRLEDQEQDAANRLTERNDLNVELTLSNTLSYTGSFGDHVIKPIVGVEFNSREYQYFSAYRQDYASESLDFRYLDAGGAGSQFNEGIGNSVNLFSYFSKVDYAFKDKLFVSGTVRIDKSSRFLEDNRTAVFPAAGLAYRLSEESFVKDLDIFSNLRLRAAWGQTGNQETPEAFPAYSTFGLNATTNNYDISGTSTSSLTGYASAKDGNPDLKWETAETLDFAIEMGLLDSRLNLEVGYYAKTTKDMLVRVVRPATSGLADDPYINIGEMSNKGWEIAANYSGDISTDFSYDVSANASFNTNEVLKLDDNEKTFIQGQDFRGSRITRTQQGQPISSFYGYQVDGFYTTQAEVDKYEQSNGSVGSFKYKDVDGDGKITDDDRTFIGSPLPDVTFGANIGLNYKNLRFSVFMDGTYGNEIYNFKKYFTDFHFFPGSVTTNVLSTWSAENPNATLPALSATGQEVANSYYVEDGSYLRIRNIKLGYDLPKKWLTDLRLDTVNVYVQIDNAYIFTEYSGLDPEVNILDDPNATDVNFNLGIDRGVYPNPRTFVFGMNIQL